MGQIKEKESPAKKTKRKKFLLCRFQNFFFGKSARQYGWVCGFMVARQKPYASTFFRKILEGI